MEKCLGCLGGALHHTCGKEPAAIASSGKSELLPAISYEEHEREMLKVIDERDYWQGKATELANDIGEALGFEVGEHTSANCPVQGAIDGLFEMRAQIEEWRGR